MLTADQFHSFDSAGELTIRALTRRHASINSSSFFSCESRRMSGFPFPPNNHTAIIMPTRQKPEPVSSNFLNDPKLPEKHRARWNKIEAERVRVHAELAKCERLTAADFAVRINARD